MKIYTRNGDAGETRLGDGSPISKATLRMECLGTIDELSACLGLSCELFQQQPMAGDDAPRMLVSLNHVQGHLSELVADLADPSGQPRITAGTITWLENEIDWWSDKLPELRAFILPGGGPAGACLHLARTICRRAERDLVRLAQHEPLSKTHLAYLNRLSDALFVMARTTARLGGFPDRIVSAGRPDPG